MQVVIMAGGKGTRIAALNSEVPKPMITVCGKPILEHQIECLKNQGIKEIILVIGYKGETIHKYFGDGSKKSPITDEPFGVNISYIEETTPLGTGGALYLLKNKLDQDFMLLNGDIIFDIDISRFYKYHINKEATATLFTHPNSHPYDSGIVITDSEGKVKKWLNREDKRVWYKNRVNAGIHMISPKIFNLFQELKKLDLDRDIFSILLQKGELFAYNSPEYVKDMGTPDRYSDVVKDLESGKPQLKNLNKKQRAIFLDRDGTINKYVGFLKNINQFELLEDVPDAIVRINKSGYLAIVITNQPVIARGETTEKELNDIHNKMETLLGQKGAYIDDIFYCPHHPDKGYAGERQEYKINCDCRKPNPGLIEQAVLKYNIDLSDSWIIGDSERDIQTGINAGCKTAFILGNNLKGQYKDLLVGTSLKDCIDKILK